MEETKNTLAPTFNPKTFGVSGLTKQEAFALRLMMKEDGMRVRSEFLRKLIRKEWSLRKRRKALPTAEVAVAK